MDCNSCEKRQRQAEPVSFLAHEADMARLNVSNRRMFVIIIILIIALVGSSAAWIWHESQYEEVVTTESYESSADGGGVAIVTRDGEVNYGESKLHEDN